MSILENSIEILVKNILTEEFIKELEEQNIDSSDIVYIVVFPKAELEMYKQVKDNLDKASILELIDYPINLLHSSIADLELYIFNKDSKEYLIGIMYC